MRHEQSNLIKIEATHPLLRLHVHPQIGIHVMVFERYTPALAYGLGVKATHFSSIEFFCVCVLSR